MTDGPLSHIGFKIHIDQCLNSWLAEIADLVSNELAKMIKGFKLFLLNPLIFMVELTRIELVTS